MNFVRITREAGAASSGGALPPSLADLDNETGTKSLPDLSKVPPADPPADPPPPAEPVEGLNEDGTLQEGYEKAEDGTIKKTEAAPPADPPADDEGQLSPEDFWKQVEAITGNELQVDYGDTDPLSPEGVAMRENVLKDAAVNDFDQYMKTTYPRAYAYFLHVQAGKGDEEFFQEPSNGLVNREEFEQDPDIQAQWILRDLRIKGIPDDLAQATVDKYIKENSLKDKAVKLYTEQEASDLRKLQAIQEQDKREKAQFQSTVDSLSTTVEKTIKSEMKLLVPETKQVEFKEFIMSKLQHDGQNFFFVQPVGQDLNTVLDSLYLQFTKGDLTAIVEKRAQTKAVQRLGAKVAQDKKTAGSGPAGNSTPKYIPLGDI
jgi:hypothetical protein